MLNYLILTTRAILLCAIVSGTVAGFTRLSEKRFGILITRCGAVIGFLTAFVIAVLRNNTSLIRSATLNHIIYVTSLSAFAVFLIFGIKVLREKKVTGGISWIALAVFWGALIVYYFPEAMMYPQKVLTSQKTALSTDFLLAMIGVVFGVAIALVSYIAAKRCVVRITQQGAKGLLLLQMLLVEAIMLSGWFSVKLQNGSIKSNHTIFSYVVFVKNHTDYFLYAVMLSLVFVAGVLLIRSLHVNEPYKNPAQHRLIRAKWMRIRRWSVTLCLSFLFGVLVLTVGEKINSMEVTLSPIEDTEYDSENVYVPFDMVSDGHLHRFAYTSEAGTQIRFIVIKKPNSQSYGIGLDACDICGETGYYEKDGQVVCKLCDVVMNVSTIGFKGGCNPIVIPYEIKNGQIIVPISGLLEYEKEFKK